VGDKKRKSSKRETKPNLSRLDAAVKRKRDEKQILTIQKNPIINLTKELDNNEEGINGRIWTHLKESDKFIGYTNFTEGQLLELVRAMNPFIASSRRRGPPPALTYAEGFILLLMILAKDFDYKLLAATFDLNEKTLQSHVSRVRPIVKEMLVERWWKNRTRPIIDPSASHPYIAAIVDSTTIPTFASRSF
jgi:hypothetical protein